jgi:hypothetical protein
MKSIQRIAIALLLGFTVTSCVQESIWVSEEVSTRDYDFTGIRALQVSSDFRAYVTFSDTEEKVSIKANDNLFRRIDAYMEGSKLVVKLENNVRVRGKETMELYVTTKNISQFKASADAAIFMESPINTNTVSIELSSDAYFEGDITADDLELHMASDSEAEMYLDVQDAYLDLSSSSRLQGESKIKDAKIRLASDAEVDMIGAIESLDAIMSSDSELKDYGLEVQDLRIDLTSDSDAFLTVTGTIDVTANSDSRLYYKGDAEIIRQVLSSDGKVIKK